MYSYYSTQTAYKVYSVSYDLGAPNRDYSGLYEALKASANWWHYLQSTWLIKTTEGPEQLWNRLSSHLDKDDRVLIIEVRANYQGWLSDEAWEWIKENVTAR